MAISYFYWTCKANIHSNYAPDTLVYIASQTGTAIGPPGQQNQHTQSCHQELGITFWVTV